MILDTRHLELVEAIVEEGTLTRAASRLYLSQSALSHQLRQVEQRLGTELFERKGRGLVLSVAGERVLRGARVVLDELRRTEADVRGLAAGRAGTLRLSMACYTTYHWLPMVLKHYEDAFPDVDVQIRTEATPNPTEGLRRHELDVAIVLNASPAGSALAFTRLFEDEMVAVVHAEHPWAERPYVEAADFSSERLLVYRASLLFRRVLEPAGVEPARVTTLPMSTEAAIEMVRAGMGITTMAAWAAQPYLTAGDLATVRITPEGLFRAWYAASRDEPRPRYVQAFLELLKRQPWEAAPSRRPT